MLDGMRSLAPAPVHLSNRRSQAPGQGCSWKKSARLKTIDSKCLFQQHGFADLCKLEKRAPFAKARDAFKAAFFEEDVTKGGCPAIVPHPPRG